MQEDKDIFSVSVLQFAADTALQAQQLTAAIMNLTFLTHANQDLITIPILMFLLRAATASPARMQMASGTSG